MNLKHPLFTASALLLVNLLLAPLSQAAIPPDYGYAELQGINLSSKDIAGGKLDNLKITDADFSGIDLRNSSATYAEFTNVNFRGADLRGVKFKYAKFIDCDLSNVRLANADLEYAEFIGSTRLSADDMGEAQLSNTALPETNAVQAPITSPVLTAITVAPNLPAYPTAPQSLKPYARSKLSDVKFIGKNLQKADFKYAELNNIDFSNSDLRGADFSHAKLRNVSFQGSNLDGANLSNTKLFNANLQQTSVSNTLFAYAEFDDGSDLRGVDFSSAQMRYAKMLSVNYGQVTETIHTDKHRQGQEPQQENESQLIYAKHIEETLPAETQESEPQLISSKHIEEALTPKTNDSGEVEQPAFINLSIQFEFNSSDVKPGSVVQLAELAKALQSDALNQADILIEGHTDDIGSEAYNRTLSERRATSVYTILSQDFGVPFHRLKPIGFGKSRPIADNISEEGRAQNRRVTIVNLAAPQISSTAATKHF
ncbi:pentapeptide repeat-containing protein [Candidatus Thiothrix anitrata]|uniref:Pentapeptide repeat-containing protein n=1 Tax=Candidatus Thiothrix anitrata TaxID=2823902 RepID=A0ABX7WYW5_9GAMM|nr:pentapeptide repeat-containing protein [Candidatus Thiothrix anitrata]QTR48926.1 pentapeptide repeat-containing protein [Candidatus Thiothrix anitrata]